VRDEHKVFVTQMLVAILGSKSTIIANIARFLQEQRPLIQTEKRLCRMLNNERIDWEELRYRNLELSARTIEKDDVIAFDPGDLVKRYACKMSHLYRVHDGSRNECGNGYEDFSVEAIQWRGGRKQHLPLYQKLINASCEDYISQNRQICDAIRTIHEVIGDNRGVWTFDRQHDRSRIFEKTLLCLKMRWILRAKENRSVIPEHPSFDRPNQYHPGLMDLAKGIRLSELPIRLTFPKRTGPLYVGWQRLRLVMDVRETPLTVLVVWDKRNEEPVILLTNLEVSSMTDAAVVFGYYLERWGKEEGYRFTKSFLNTEDIRALNWTAIQSLALLAFLVYAFVALFYRSAPDQVEQAAEERLNHFKNIEEVKYKYYRVAQLMRIILCEQLGRTLSPLGMTEVG
jgi:hypothetical protein